MNKNKNPLGNQSFTVLSSQLDLKKHLFMYYDCSLQ